MSTSATAASPSCKVRVIYETLFYLWDCPATAKTAHLLALYIIYILIEEAVLILPRLQKLTYLLKVEKEKIFAPFFLVAPASMDIMDGCVFNLIT